MDGDKNLKLSPQEIATAFLSPHWAERFPPVLTVEEAAELLRIPKGTIYEWRSRGQLSGCCRKAGKHLRFFRDRLMQKIFNDGINK